jgi:hypothetical protein
MVSQSLLSIMLHISEMQNDIFHLQWYLATKICSLLIEYVTGSSTLIKLVSIWLFVYWCLSSWNY